MASNVVEDAVKKFCFDPDKLSWTAREGPKGAYEICIQRDSGNNGEFEKMVYFVRNMMRAVKGGKFYWLFRDGTAVGRKNVSDIKRGKKK